MGFSGQFLPSERTSVARKKLAATPLPRVSAMRRIRVQVLINRLPDRSFGMHRKMENSAKNLVKDFLAEYSIFFAPRTGLNSYTL